MFVRALAAVCSLFAVGALAEKPTITWKPPPSTDDDRPVIAELVVGPQGTDYAFKVEFNKEPWGEACHARCANATIFVDTDNNKNTGLKLKDPKAPETGADIAVIIQGARETASGNANAVLRVRVKQFTDESGLDEGNTLIELDPKSDAERVLAQGTSVYLLIDTNLGNLPTAQTIRVIYHPPETKPMVGTARGMLAVGGNRVEIFKDGKLSNPVQKKKNAYEKY